MCWLYVADVLHAKLDYRWKQGAWGDYVYDGEEEGKKRCVRLLQVMELHHWSTSHWISDYNRKQMANCAL